MFMNPLLMQGGFNPMGFGKPGNMPMRPTFGF